MVPWPLRLHYRIVIPFVLIALVTTSAAVALALVIVSRTFQSRIEAQVLNTSEVISRGGFPLNPAILRSVKAMTGADVITFATDGTVLATTLDPGRDRLLAAVTAAAPGALAGGDGAPVREVACDTPCSVSYRRVADRADAIVAVLVETSDVSEATRTIARTLLPGVAVSLIAMVLVSQVVARRVTAPIDRLVLFAREAAPDASPRRAEAGDDEVGRLGQAFNEMLDRLEQSQHALVRSEKLALAGMLAARMAHDIRNPLSSIKMHAQLLQSRGRGDEHSRTLVDAILRDVGTVEWVIRDLIELARPGELKLEPADLNAVVRDVLGQLEARLTHRKIVVEADLAEPLPSIPLDIGRFQQALVNLILNAADAMPNGGRLGVSTQVPPAASTLVVEVSDDGVGIDPAILDRVFDPFVSSKPDGVGLGLVNVKAVVEHHGGRIELAARQPRGTRARITLPVREG